MRTLDFSRGTEPVAARAAAAIRSRLLRCVESMGYARTLVTGVRLAAKIGALSVLLGVLRARADTCFLIHTLRICFSL